MLAAAGLCGLIAVACADQSAGVVRARDQPSTSATSGVSDSPSPTVALHVPGRVTGTVTLHDAKLGNLTVVTSVSRKRSGACAAAAYLRVVDATGRVLLRRDWDWGCAELRPNRPSQDDTGNVFLTYNPGRYDGVIILRGAGGRIDNFGTLPLGGWHYIGSGPFGYYARTQDEVPQDGTLEIRQFSNDCRPSCADGTTTSRLFVWNGAKYVRRGPRRVE